MRNRWEDWVNLLIGIWLFVSPWVMGYSTVQAPALNAYVMGAALILLTAIALYIPRRWEEWVNSIIGLWMVVSPWILGFSAMTAVTWNAAIIGLAVLAISLEATRSSRQIAA